MNKKIIYSVFAVIVILAVALFNIFKTSRNNPTTINSSPNQTATSPTQNSASPVPNISTSPTVSPNPSGLSDPIADFKARITKKPFGIYVTPQNSPIQPERFTGYHTGADAEYQDILADVPVYACADGTVVLSETAAGYGGVFMIQINLDGSQHNILYGHIRPSSLPKVGSKVTKGEQLAVLGTGYSSETDGERRHLHFAILSNTRLDIKGYVQTQAELSGWLNPLNYF